MPANISTLDYVFLAYMAWCFVKGLTRGMHKEFKGLLFSLLLLAGLFGLFAISQLTGLIRITLQNVMSSSGILISLSSFILAMILFFFLRHKIADLATTGHSEKTSRTGGALAGLIRSLVVISIFTIILNHIPFGIFSESLQASILASWIGSVAGINQR